MICFMYTKRRRVTLGLLATLAAGILIWILALASGALAGDAGVPTSPPLWFKPTQQQPVAGRVFTGLVLGAGSAEQFTPNCGHATVGHKGLAAQTRTVLKSTQWDATICSWRIPKSAGRKQLRVVGAEAGTAAGAASLVPTISWRIRG